MKAPDKIYIEQDMINNIPLERQYYEDDVIYIRKDVLLEWMKEKLAFCKKMILNGEPGFEFKLSVYEKLIEKLESL